MAISTRPILVKFRSVIVAMGSSGKQVNSSEMARPSLCIFAPTELYCSRRNTENVLRSCVGTVDDTGKSHFIRDGVVVSVKENTTGESG